MAVSAPAAGKANGLSTVVNVLVAPKEAFETLRVIPTWGWAFIVACVLAMIGQYIATPAAVHALQASWPAQVASNPQLAAMTPAQQQRGLAFGMTFVRYFWLFMPIAVLIGALLQSVIMLIFKAAGKGDAGFKQLWCAAMNCLVIGVGMYSLVNGLIAVVRGASAYSSAGDTMRAIPSLAWIAPGASLKVVAFLAAFNVISIWGAVVLAIAMMNVARVSRANAVACAITTTTLAGLYFGLTAR